MCLTKICDMEELGLSYFLISESCKPKHGISLSRDFYQRARLDKQNMIPSLDWTGQALYDLANTRVKCCATGGEQPSLRSFIDKSIDDQRIIDAFAALRTPRHLFKFMYRLLVAHCNAYTDDQPVWEVTQELFEATFSVYRRDQDAVDRGLRAG